MDVLHYLTPAGVDPVQVWLDGLNDLKARVAVLRTQRADIARALKYWADYQRRSA